MPYLDRFSVSLDTELLAAFDVHIASRGYENRSEAIRDLIRDQLTTVKLQQDDRDVAAALTLVCDHLAGEAPSRLRKLLADQGGLVRAKTGVMLDENRELETITLRGTVVQVQALADAAQALRGITHVSLASVPCEKQP